MVDPSPRHKLRLTPAQFTNYLLALRKSFMEDYVVETPWDINTGLCEDFADTVESAVEGVAVFCYENFPLDEVTRGLGHVFIFWNGRYYDAECVGGVTDPRKLPLYSYNKSLRRMATTQAKLRFREWAREASRRGDCRQYRRTGGWGTHGREQR